METTPDRCPSAPSGESHRWRIPDQGVTGPSHCKWCGAERTFAASGPDTWADIEAAKRGAKAGNAASRQARREGA